MQLVAAVASQEADPEECAQVLELSHTFILISPRDLVNQTGENCAFLNGSSQSATLRSELISKEVNFDVGDGN